MNDICRHGGAVEHQQVGLLTWLERADWYGCQRRSRSLGQGSKLQWRSAPAVRSLAQPLSSALRHPQTLPTGKQ